MTANLNHTIYDCVLAFELEKSQCPTTRKQREQQIYHPFIGLERKED